MLDTLPDDILYIILSYLDTAQSIRALILTNKRLRNVINSNDHGWCIFVRSRFPFVSTQSLSPSTATTSWHHVADSLTWQSRAWDRRSLSFQAMMPTPPQRTNPRVGRRRHETPFHAIVDAYLDLSTQEELVVWGAGQDLIARRRQGRLQDKSPKKTTWHRLDGKDLSYVAGPDDYKALAIVGDVCGTAGNLGVLVGQDNGHLALRSVDEASFGQKLADFHPQHRDIEAGGDWAQETINSIDVLRSKNIMVSTSRFGISLYDLPDSLNQDVAPSAHFSLPNEGIGRSRPTLFQAKWMGEDTLAFGLSGSNSPLRYIQTTPAGFSETTIVKNANLEERFAISYTANSLCHGSLTPIDASSILGGGANLLLSSWRDGTIRLQDLRTPSPLDLVYCDNFEPWTTLGSLLPFGTSHFVAAGGHSALVKIFDFRWSRPYHHTNALPCSPKAPLPRTHQPFTRAPPDPGPSATVCRSSLLSSSPCLLAKEAASCRWHELSRTLYHRPNGTFFLSNSLPYRGYDAGVWSLARASPSLSPNFYMGISGGVVEASLSVASSRYTTCPDLEVDPHFGYRLEPPNMTANNDDGSAVNCFQPTANADLISHDQSNMGAQYTRYCLHATAFMEKGDGLRDKNYERNVRMPPIRGKEWIWQLPPKDKEEKEGIPEELVRRNRLDPRFHMWADYEDILPVAGVSARQNEKAG